MAREYTTQGMLNTLCLEIKAWREEKHFDTNWLNVPEKLMLVVTELAEAMEEYRHLPDWILTLLEDPDGRGWIEKLAETDESKDKGAAQGRLEMFEEEVADTLIRLFDLCGSLNIDIEKAVHDKMLRNEKRPPLHGKQR